jgi:LuxR family maltose regulon positive regulatory protein
VHRLLEALGVESKDPEQSTESFSPLVEPLTRRELEVLQCMCAGSSNQEIAAKLVITQSTVKKHTGSIDGKLGVSSRTQAIVRAYQLRLASPDP